MEVKMIIIKKITKILVLTPLLLIVIINIISSQAISPLYFQLVNENKDSIVRFLTLIKPAPFFMKEYIRYKNTYGASIDTVVFKEDKETEKQIQKLEGALNKNPQARDILIELSRLYKNMGDSNTSNKYEEKARSIDPSIN